MILFTYMGYKRQINGSKGPRAVVKGGMGDFFYPSPFNTQGGASFGRVIDLKYLLSNVSPLHK